MSRRLLAVGGLLVLVGLAGCFGPAEIPDEQLAGNVSYDWDTDAAAAYSLSRSSYTAVYELTNRSTLAVHDRDPLGVEAPVDISALRFRYPNGTVVNATHDNLSAQLQQRRTIITLPNRSGQVAYTAARSGKQFSTPVVVEGRQTITLRPGARVGIPLLSQVRPGNVTTRVGEDNRMTIAWHNQTSGSLSVQFYLQRDVLLFSLLLLVTLTAGIGGSVYYLRQIRQLEAEREEIGLDVDTEDEGDRGPPPGMR